jgi:surface antigen
MLAFRPTVIAAVSLAAAALAGCQTGNLGTGLIAYAPVPEPAGVLAGGAIGGGLDQADQRAALAAEFRALDSGQTGLAVVWRGRSGNHGEVVPGARYRINDLECRSYSHTVTYGDEHAETAHAAACRDAKGDWHPVG